MDPLDKSIRNVNYASALKPYAKKMVKSPVFPVDIGIASNQRGQIGLKRLIIVFYVRTMI